MPTAMCIVSSARSASAMIKMNGIFVAKLTAAITDIRVCGNTTITARAEKAESKEE